MIRIIYFVHGTTYDNEAKKSSGWNDVELSPQGVEQAKKLEELWKEKWRHIDVVISSDLKRAKDTLCIAFKDVPIKLHDPRLRECNYGDLNGQDSQIVEPLQEQKIFERFVDGECYEDVKERVALLLEEIKEKYEGKTVALVAHKAPQICLDVLLKGKSFEQAFLDDWRKNKNWQPGWEYMLK